MKFKLILFFSSAFIIFAGSFFYFKNVYAGEKFGGRVKSELGCENGGKILWIGPPKGGLFYYGLGARTYLFGAPKPGRWALGLSAGIFLCKRGHIYIPGKKITIVGTSLF